MYLSKKVHILTPAIMLTAIFNLLSELASGLARIVLSKLPSLTPDMLDTKMWTIQSAFAILQLLLTIGVFLVARKKLNRLMKLIPREDWSDMGKLQSEMIKDSVATLSITEINQLLQVWAAILIGVEIVYDVTSSAYKSFVTQLVKIVDLSNPETYNAFVALYNSTHGFKYIGMLIAICIGILTTGIFLQDRWLITSSITLTVLFLIAFVFIQSNTIVLASRMVGVVWTSVIFHILQTLGLMVLSAYLFKRYRGL